MATGHRLLAELVSGGFLERMPDGAYRVGFRLWQIGVQASAARELRELALPYMEDLYAATRENVQLAVLRGDKALYVERLRGPNSVPILTQLASELSLHATGVGKVLLAYAPEDVVRRVLGGELTAHTTRTITDPAVLAGELEEIRRTGIAWTDEEMTLGSRSVAVPVRQGERVVAALSLVARRHSGDVRKLAPAVVTAARALSRDLTAHGTGSQAI